jgi:hypothetical protein
VLIKDVAESLCVHPFMLSRWRKQVRDGELVGDPPPQKPQEAAELQRRRESKRQQEDEALTAKVRQVHAESRGFYVGDVTYLKVAAPVALHGGGDGQAHTQDRRLELGRAARRGAHPGGSRAIGPEPLR